MPTPSKPALAAGHLPKAPRRNKPNSKAGIVSRLGIFRDRQSNQAAHPAKPTALAEIAISFHKLVSISSLSLFPGSKLQAQGFPGGHCGYPTFSSSDEPLLAPPGERMCVKPGYADNKNLPAFSGNLCAIG
jgi:hypothetical protein